MVDKILNVKIVISVELNSFEMFTVLHNYAERSKIVKIHF